MRLQAHEEGWQGGWQGGLCRRQGEGWQGGISFEKKGKENKVATSPSRQSFFQIFNDAYDLNFKNSVEAMGSRLHVKRCQSQDWHNEVSHGCSIGSAMDDASK